MRAGYRVIVNSGALYIKMLLSLFITFYSTRIILQNLGIDDFGIYNLVASTVSLLGFINGSMANTVQRFLAYEIGHGVFDRLKKVFAISLSLHLWVGFGIVIVLELLGIISFDNIFNIASDKVDSAKIAYQIMIWVAFLSTISSPFAASIYAHEEIAIFAIADFISTILKLVAALLLSLFETDKLIYYSCFILFIQLIHFIFEAAYCFLRYNECRRIDIVHIDKKLKNEVFPFLGWNMLESCSWLAKNQGVAILMNTFYGTVVNAAYGIGNQVQGQVMFFSSSLLSAIRPQIYKAGGNGNIPQMVSLSITASKFAFFMMLLILVPLAFILDDILKLWLNIVPEYTERICLLLILISLINYLSTGVGTAIQAYGRVKEFQIIVSVMTLGAIPIGYILYSQSSNVYLFLYVMVVLEILLTFLKYKIAAKVLNIKLNSFIKGIFVPCVIVFLCSFSFSFLIYQYMNIEQLYEYIVYILLDVISVVILIYILGLSKKEKSLIRDIVVSLKYKSDKIRNLK